MITIWYSLLNLFILISCIIFGFLYRYSKDPEEWKHISALENLSSIGRLEDLAETIKVSPVDYSSTSHLNDFINNLFLDRVIKTKSLSNDEIKKIQIKDKNMLNKIIEDEEIVEWITNPDNTIKKGVLGSDSVKQKKNYLEYINRILDRMERWGK